jgi:hypothetical protein
VKNRWTSTDRRNFADRNILKSSRIPGRRPAGPSIEEWSLDMATEHNEQLEQKVRELYKIANDLAERLVSLGHHQDTTVRAWHRHIMRKKT